MRLPAPHPGRSAVGRLLGLEREQDRAARLPPRPDDLVELSASTYIDQLQRFKVLDNEMPNLFRDASDMIAVPRRRGLLRIWDMILMRD